MPPLNPDFIVWVDRQIDAALSAGRITPRSAPQWRAKLEADPGPTLKTWGPKRPWSRSPAPTGNTPRPSERRA